MSCLLGELWLRRRPKAMNRSDEEVESRFSARGGVWVHTDGAALFFESFSEIKGGRDHTGERTHEVPTRNGRNAQA